MKLSSKKKILVTDSNGFLGKKLCTTLSKKKYQIIYVSCLMIDISNAVKLLNWKPLVDFDKAISITVNYFYDKKS